MYLPDAGREVHMKGAYPPGAPVFAVKTATGLYRNAGLGLPVIGGMTLVHDAVTGALRMLIADGGLLTELRTAPPRTQASCATRWRPACWRRARCMAS